MADVVIEEAELIRMKIQLATVFSPSAPIGSIDLFAGRMEQIGQSVSAVSQQGQHVILFGERGVGKTSLAGLVHEFWTQLAKDESGVFSVRYNCDRSDTYGTIWANIVQNIRDGFDTKGEAMPSGDSWEELSTQLLDGGASPHSVRRLLDIANKTFIIVIDEFDQVNDDETVALFSSTIKNMSDNLSQSTLVLVGVADTVEELIRDHASIDRALIQILMPRMLENELTEIIRKGYERVGLNAQPHILEHMGRLAQGLPHYAHRFGQEAGATAINRGSSSVESQDVHEAVHQAISHTNETIRSAYQRATTSPQKDAIFKQVLLACALATGDELGYFAAGDIRGPLHRITKKHYGIPQFVGHLKKFATDRGPVLQSVGEQWKRRYRFSDPLMRPYVVLSGIDSGLIPEGAAEFSPNNEHGQQQML